MSNTQGLMAGKRGLVMGLANNRSIAWGVAKALAEAGAEVGFTYQGDALRKRVEPLAEELGGVVFGDCDVSQPELLEQISTFLTDGYRADIDSSLVSALYREFDFGNDDIETDLRDQALGVVDPSQFQ